MKRLMLIISLLLICCYNSAVAQDAQISEGWWYVLNETGVTITDYTRGEEEITVPETLNGNPVTALGKGLFKDDQNVKKINIPDSVSVIAAEAFMGCMALIEIHLPSNLEIIDTQSFMFCIALEEIDLPVTVKSIQRKAFYGCIHLKSIEIPNSVTFIGLSAFEDCQALTSVIISENLSWMEGRVFFGTPWLESQSEEFVIIGKNILIKWNGDDANVTVPYGVTIISDAFADKAFIESVTLPDTIRTIGYYAFQNDANLKTINFPNGLTTIATEAFGGCRSLKDVTFPESVSFISGTAFRRCEKLTHFSFPSKVTTIFSNTLADCSSLTDVVIPESVTRIDPNPFNGSENVRLQVVYGSFPDQFAFENEIPYTYILQETDDFIYNRDSENVKIIRYIGNLVDIEIPSEIGGMPVTSIGTAAFQNNPFVRRVVVPLTVKTIGDWAFSYMDSLETIILHSGVESIGANAFIGDPMLAELKFPGSLTEVGPNVIDKDSLTKICGSEGTPSYEQLTNDGYQVHPVSACSADDVLLDQWSFANLTVGMTIDPEQVGTLSTPAALITARYGEDIQILTIPQETVSLTAGLMQGAGSNLILIIPDSVTSIDPVILEGRNLTIVGNTGSYAEQFARENNVKFIVRVIAWLGD